MLPATWAGSQLALEVDLDQNEKWNWSYHSAVRKRYGMLKGLVKSYGNEELTKI
jgi:hypothetical protein